jgi:hypothetical protein
MASLALAVRADDNQESPIAVLIREMASPSIDDRESLVAEKGVKLAESSGSG